MPGFDGTGPAGQGPMTGRRMGNCNSGRTGNVNRPAGQGLGSGLGTGLRCGWRGREMGAGRGFRNRFVNAPIEAMPTMNQDEQIEELQIRVEELEAELKAIRQRNENSDNQR